MKYSWYASFTAAYDSIEFNNTVTFTTLSNDDPEDSNIDCTFFNACLASPAGSPFDTSSFVPLVGSKASCPATNTKSSVITALLNNLLPGIVSLLPPSFNAMHSISHSAPRGNRFTAKQKKKDAEKNKKDGGASAKEEKMEVDEDKKDKKKEGNKKC